MSSKELRPLQLIHILGSNVEQFINIRRPDFEGDQSALSDSRTLANQKDLWLVLYVGQEAGTDHRHGDNPAYRFITVIPLAVLSSVGLEAACELFIATVPIDTNVVSGSVDTDTVTVIPQEEYRIQVTIPEFGFDYVQNLHEGKKAQR